MQFPAMLHQLLVRTKSLLWNFVFDRPIAQYFAAVHIHRRLDPRLHTEQMGTTPKRKHPTQKVQQ
jgi:hypothetical protein